MMPSTRLLLVEDDPTIRHTLTLLLKRRGYAVTAAGDVAEARAKLEEADPQAAVLDLMLPDGSGLDLLRAVKANARPGAGADGSAVHVVVVTGTDEPRDLAAARELGAAAVLRKPVALEELLAALQPGGG